MLGLCKLLGALFFIEGGNSLSFHYMGTTGVLQEYCV